MSHGPALTPARAPRWHGALLVLVSALAAATAGCAKQSASADLRKPVTVEVGRENIAVASVTTMRVGPAISGTLEAKRAATLRAEVSGPVVETPVERGQPVKRGQLLARIDDTSLRENLFSAQSASRSAQLALDNARRDLERSTTLEKAGAIAQRDLEAAQRALAAAQAQSADAQARLTAAREQVDKTRIRAPFTGVVSERPVNAGDVVQPGAALVTVVDPTSMRLDASVPAEQIASVRVGAPVRFSVNGYPDRVFDGHVDRVNPAADPATRQVRVSVSIPNDRSALVAGLFAQGSIASDTRQTLQVPMSAVDQRGTSPMVLRLHLGRTESAVVQLGLRDAASGNIEILAGLAAGDTVLLGAAQAITPGTPVKVGDDQGARGLGDRGPGNGSLSGVPSSPAP